MKYNELDLTKSKTKKRVGRGIAAGQGKTAGRGTKGQGARTGKKLGAMFQGGQRALVQAIPKERGFKSKRTPAQVVYLDHLNALAGITITNELLFERGYIESPFIAVKVIARGELTENVTLHVLRASKSVQAEIAAKGGSFVKTSVPLKQSQETIAAAEQF